MFDNRSSPEQTFVGSKKHEENDELLVKVLKLTEDLPTSSDRLRKVAGFFIAVHGPRDEDIVVAHNFDCGVVESLKIAMMNIWSSYAQLKDPHEVKCARYEKDVEHILEEMNRQAGVESIGIHAFGDVGLGTAQESLHVVAPSQHEYVDVDIEKPLENDIRVDSVAGSPICLVSNVVPGIFTVEPHITVLCEDVVVVRTSENPDNANVATVGQCNEGVVVSPQPSGETILVRCEEQQHEESDTEGKYFVSNNEVNFMFYSFLIADHELPVVTPSSIDPSLLKRYNELYTAITRARRDNKKKDMIDFRTEVADITIGEVGQPFWNRGMLTTSLVNFNISLLGDKFKGSPTMVVLFHICSSIWNGATVGRSVKLMFSSKSEERVDKKDMVLFATFDPLEMRDGIGHYCVVALNVKERRFEFVDLLNKPDSSKENKA
ncbi:hypothetical protein D1007_00144 [Hordeum vulgare]|nr:hypothetical protein D1007_00144 [Hordeum vulgare]